jgi:hypothetical protein
MLMNKRSDILTVLFCQTFHGVYVGHLLLQSITYSLLFDDLVIYTVVFAEVGLIGSQTCKT